MVENSHSSHSSYMIFLLIVYFSCAAFECCSYTFQCFSFHTPRTYTLLLAIWILLWIQVRTEKLIIHLISSSPISLNWRILRLQQLFSKFPYNISIWWTTRKINRRRPPNDIFWFLSQTFIFLYSLFMTSIQCILIFPCECFLA